MSFYARCKSLPERFRVVRNSFLQQDGLPFADVLSEQSIQHAFDTENASFAEDDDDVYTPAVTLWAFLSQVLFKGEQRSCAAAVARVVVLLAALGRRPCSGNTGAYCRARMKLSETVLRRLATEVAAGCEQQVPSEWLWHGRSAYLVDGTAFSMPDTPGNQAEYPQHWKQQKGLGFPLARMVVLLSLATGMIRDVAIGPNRGKGTGEPALLRQLLADFRPGDLLVADRYYCSYFLIALLRELGVDFVARLHQRRECDFRRGRRLGKGDHVVEWVRPVKPKWMDDQTYERMPESIEVREIHVNVEQAGFRCEELFVVTTLTDAQVYPKDDVAELFRSRWHVELDIEAIKITLDMDVLRCRSPEMVRKEAWTCLLAYNLIRRSMLQSAAASGLRPRQLSFALAVQTIASSWLYMATAEDSSARSSLIDAELSNMSGHLVGNRPDRIEPRAVKRRPKPHALLTKPRREARAELLAGKAA